jgi:hypothetical protein
MDTRELLRSRKDSKVKALPVTLLFLVWPFALLLTSLKNFHAPGAKKGFILFCIYFGFVFVISKDLGGADSARYAQMLRDLHQNPSSFSGIWASLYSYETNLLDIYQPLLTWLVSLFTDNAQVLFSLFALVFGWFYANNIWIILSRFQDKISYQLILFMLVFSLIIPIWYINGVRMWTAAQIFIYGVLVYFIENKKYGLWWVSGSLVVHFSFLFPLLLLFIFILLPKRLPIYLVFFIATFFITDINVMDMKSYLLLLPEIFQPRVNAYTGAEYVRKIEEAVSDTNWYVGFSATALKISIYSLLITLIIHGRKFLKRDKVIYNYICFVLLFYGWANLISTFPSGGRFLAIANSLSMIFIILYLTKYKINWSVRFVRILVIPLLLFYVVFSIRVGFDYMGISTFIGNPFSAILLEDVTPLIELVKSIVYFIPLI